MELKTATENPLRPARGTELSVPLSVPRVGLFRKSIFPATQVVAIKRLAKSGRLDLNQRPLRPERSALSRLSYAPFC